MQRRQNPQRVAWTVLLSSFFLCTVCSIALPLSVRNYVLHATQSRAAYVTAMAGTAQLRAPGSDEPTAVTGERRAVPEGSAIMTGKSDRALLEVTAPGSGEQVVLTAQMYQDSAVRLEEARTPRFRWSQEPVRITLFLESGRMAVTNGRASDRPIALAVNTPGAQVTLGPGSFLVEIQGQNTLVTSRFGVAQVQGAGSVVTANNEQRVSVTAGQAPDAAVPAPLNLVRNGAFDDGALTGWNEVHEGAQPGQALVETVGTQNVVRFVRRQEDDAPNMVGIRQTVNRDVQGYDSLSVRLDLQLLHQSVPGGGYQDSEYPVMIDVFYTDVYGKDLHWYHSFYYQDLPPGSNWKAPTGERLPVGAWYSYESPNLLDELRNTRPARINYITVSASGHDYESRVTNVALTVR